MMSRAYAAGGAGRLAVSGLFFCNGVLVGSWAPKLPVLMQRLGIGEAVAGLLVLALGLGSLVVMPLVGAMVARRGSDAALRLMAVLACLPLLLVTLAPGLWTVAVAVFLFGGMLGGMDVAMNANAVAVERARRRAIMSSCHGFWSLGAMAGAGLGGMLMAGLGETRHGLMVTLLVGLAVACLLPRLLHDRPSAAERGQKLRLPRSPMPYVIGAVALCCMIPEGAVLDWAAVYLKRELGASLSLAGWGFAACSGTMAVMRFLGDGLRRRLGAVRTLRLSAMAAIAGLGLAGMAGNAGWAIAGFGLAGLGIANMVPIAFSAAGNLPGMARGVGLSVVTMMGYSGMLFAPGSIGFLAEHVSLASIYAGLAVLLLVPLSLSHLVAAADFEARE